jgi:hypothetical protein
VAGVEQQHAGADQLVLGQTVHLRERADQVVAGFTLPGPGQATQVRRELLRRAYGPVGRLPARVQLVHPADVRRPGSQRRAVRRGYPQKLCDHGDRQRLGDGRDEVSTALPDQVRGQPVGEGRHDRAQRLHPARGERGRHQPPQPGVVGRLAVEHPVADHVPERRQVRWVVRPPEVRVGRLVQVRTSEPAVAQQRVHVVVARDQPLVGRLEVPDRRLLTQLRVGGVRVGDERRRPRVELLCHA